MKKILILLLSIFVVLTPTAFGQEELKDGIVPLLREGIMDQAMPDLNIKESEKGALDKGSYCLKIKPEGNYATFNSDLKLESSEGKNVIENVKVTGDTIDFDIKYQSSTISTISLKDVKLTVNRNAIGGQYHIYLYNKKDMDEPIFDIFYFYISQSDRISPDSNTSPQRQIIEKPEIEKTTEKTQNNKEKNKLFIIKLIEKIFM